jgi:hypothetical protein
MKAYLSINAEPTVQLSRFRRCVMNTGLIANSEGEILIIVSSGLYGQLIDNVSLAAFVNASYLS